MKKQDLPDVSTKNTKEQILAPYSQALEHINQKKAPMAGVQRFAKESQSIESYLYGI